MSALNEVVQRYVVRPSHAGSGVQDFDRVALQRELRRLRRSREVGYWILFFLFGVLFIGAFVMVVQYRSDPAAIRQISTATGVTLTGIVAAMTNLWAQKVRTDLVIAIVMAMPEEAVKAVLTTLSGKL